MNFSNPQVSRDMRLGERRFTSATVELGTSDNSGVGVRNEDELVSWLSDAPATIVRERLVEQYVLPLARAMTRD